MLQAFVQNISSVSRRMLPSFLIWMLHMFHTYVAIVCSKMFLLFQSYVAASSFMLQVTSVIFWMFHVFYTHVVSACSKYFIYFQTNVSFKCFSLCCKCFMLVGQGEPGARGRCARRARGLQTGALGAGGRVLRLRACRVPTLECRPRGERRADLRNDRRA
jgi:hypothetical protein